jgi:hypothetical protein
MANSVYYYRRQADTLRALAESTSDIGLSTCCRNLAVRYRLLAEQAATAPVPDAGGAPPRPAGEADPDGR